MEKFQFLWKENQNFKVQNPVIKYPIKVQKGSKLKENDVVEIKEIIVTFVDPGIMERGVKESSKSRGL